MTSDVSLHRQPYLSATAVQRSLPRPRVVGSLTAVTAVPVHLGDGLRLARDLLAESRPPVQFVFALRFVVASDLLYRPSLRAGLALLGWLCLSVAIYVFNGVTDVAADVLNLSGRPIAAGRLAPQTALTCCVLLSIVGTALLARQGLVLVVLALVFLLVGWAYSAGPSWKEDPIGFGVVIGAGAAVTYGAGWTTRGSLSASEIITGLAVALWVGLCCACKDFSDIEGDAAAGRRTWPVLLGRERARTLIAVLAIAMSAGALGLALALGSGLSTACLLLGGSLGLTVTLASSARAATRGRRRLSYRVFLTTQYLANISIAL
ncbi:MAG: homogenitisate phytyltransferase [Frankiales bacterium]|nr:homogenitisate phytyltransferase [Frankiales bacterium]